VETVAPVTLFESSRSTRIAEVPEKGSPADVGATPTVRRARANGVPHLFWEAMIRSGDGSGAGGAESSEAIAASSGAAETGCGPDGGGLVGEKGAVATGQGGILHGRRDDDRDDRTVAGGIDEVDGRRPIALRIWSSERYESLRERDG